MTVKPTKESVKELLDYLGNRLFHIQNYYQVYSELGLHYNKAVDSESSKVYLGAVNEHKGFFMPVQECLRATLTVELCSFIVKKERKYKSIGKLIDDLKELPKAPDLNEKYDQLLRKNANIANHLEKFRNQYFAHKSFADSFKLPPSSDKEFQELLSDIFKLLSEANAYFETDIYFVDAASADTHNLMNNLLRGGSQRFDDAYIEHISNRYEAGRDKWHNA
jgi:hypothetical protein